MRLEVGNRHLSGRMDDLIKHLLTHLLNYISPGHLIKGEGPELG